MMKCPYIDVICISNTCMKSCVYYDYKPKIKPPLGLTPKFVKDVERRQEILDAISRYVEAEMSIPIEWIEEYNELITNEINDKKGK